LKKKKESIIRKADEDVGSLAGCSDFMLSILWTGPEDKPFYRAVFLSESRSEYFISKQFWGHSVVSGTEFNHFLGILEKNGCHLSLNKYLSVGDPGYYIEIETTQETVHVFLGACHEAQSILAKMENSLRKIKRAPISNIIMRLNGYLRNK